MACLFCGKDIGPIRILRDREFCSPKHRKQYKDRLQKVLVRVGEPETVPAGIAPFRDPARLQAGRVERSRAPFDFTSISGYRPRFPHAWTLAIPEAGGSFFARFSLTAYDLSGARPAGLAAPEALPYFGKRAGGERFAMPAAALGAVVLRSLEGGLLSPPIALDNRTPRETARGSRTAEALPPSPRKVELALPGLALPAADCEEMARAAEPAAPPPPQLREAWMPGPALQPAAGTLQPSLAGAIPIAAKLRLPQTLPAGVPPQPTQHESAEPAPLRESWMPGQQPEPAVSSVRPSAAGALPARAALCEPSPLSAPAPSLQPALHAEYLPAAAPRLLDVEARPAAPVSALAGFRGVAPNLAGLEIPYPALAAPSKLWTAAPESEPVTREVQPTAVLTPAAFAGTQPQMVPLVLELAPDAMARETAAEEVPAAKARSVEALPPRPAAPKAPTLTPVQAAPAAHSSAPVAGTPALRFPDLGARSGIPQAPYATGDFDSQSLEAVPYGDLLTVEYHCQTGPESPLARLQWVQRTVGVQAPRFAVRPIFDRLEDLSAKQDRKPGLARILSMPDAARRKAIRHALTAIAASVTVTMALWFGASAGKFGRDLLNRDTSNEVASASPMGSGSSSSSAGTADAAPRPAPSLMSSPVAWVKQRAAARAAVQMSDAFDKGMEAWGMKAKSWAPGWSRHPDGYVRPGQLALFQPTLHFTDYRMEFFGQLESKSMSWVVRGQDPQNYYAMKFNVVQPGLRPIISMVHYPVVGGRPGKKVEMPLSVMVHNDTPYHVAVDVKGSHFTASIEGQEVDEWTDDALMAGGVGFFSEAGARARIYWMKVTKNDDWLGRLCGYLAGGAESRDTAWLERPEIPLPAPQRPLPAPSAPAVWVAETVSPGFDEMQRGRASVKGGIEKWSS